MQACPMEIKFSCSCGQKVAVDSSAGGQTFPCPSCQNTLTVPEIVQETKPEKPQLTVHVCHVCTLSQLQAAGLVRKRIAERMKIALPEYPWETIVRQCSDLLTTQGFEMSLEWERFLERRQ